MISGRSVLSNVHQILFPWLMLFLLVGCQVQPKTPAAKVISDGPTGQISATPIKDLNATPGLSDDNNNGKKNPEISIQITTATPKIVSTLTPTSSPTPPPTATEEVLFPAYTGPPLNPGDAGIQIHLHREDIDTLMTHLGELGLGWVKTQVSWKLYQPEPDRFDDFRWEELDRLVATAEDQGVRVMLSVAKAPEWSRPTTELDGAPTDASNFQTFMATLATRYRGRVAAYELWNEPNLQREWNGMSLSASDLVDLIRAGASGVRQVDSEAILISGAPATTGINDGITAIDDRIFLQQMIGAGITDVVDAIGAHPYGWANPPDSSANSPDPSIPSHNNHRSFFFGDTLQDYRTMLDLAGKTETPIWVTEFGWGSYDGLGIPAPEEVAYMAYVDEQQQAAYTLQSYEFAHEIDWLGPLILWNLNFGPTLGPDFPVSAYSVLRPDGSPRPVYFSLAAIPWVDDKASDVSQ